jgi:hypothetical protein
VDTDVVAFHELTFVPDGAEVVVGRPDTGAYVVLPADGAALLARMVDGISATAAADWYDETYGEPVDIDEFLETLGEFGFVRAPDDKSGEVRARPGLVRLGRMAFSPLAWLLYAALLGWWLIELTHHSDLLPRPRQVFFVPSLVVIQLVLMFSQMPLVFLHEGAHVLAGSRLGLPSRLGVSNRLIDVVFETRMNSVLSVPRRQRYLPFLSGMACDVVVWALLDLVAQFTRAPDGSLSLVGRLALALAFTTVVRIVWQFQLYLRTDLYYVFATAWNCYDLHPASMALIRNRLWRLLGVRRWLVDEDQWTERDRRIGRWYGPFIAFGICVFLGITLWGSVPILLRYVGIVAARLGAHRLDANFWDLVVSLVLNVGNFALIAVLARRKRRAARSRPLGGI